MNSSSPLPPPELVEEFAWPISREGVISSCFGIREPVFEQNTAEDGAPQKRKHGGLDIAVNRNTTVEASRAGVISEATFSAVYGDYVVILHPDGFKTRYAHLASLEDVKVGEHINQGVLIGQVGLTGMTTGKHLHFEIINPQGKTVNPAFYLKQRVGGQLILPEDDRCWHQQAKN